MYWKLSFIIDMSYSSLDLTFMLLWVGHKKVTGSKILNICSSWFPVHTLICIKLRDDSSILKYFKHLSLSSELL